MAYRFSWLVLTALASSSAEAGVYKCLGSGGKVIYSSEPCEAVGARKEKTLGKAVLKGNEIRMRPRPPQGDGSPPEFGSGSSFKGAVPENGGRGDPRKRD
jgi:hypothetical protein